MKKTILILTTVLLLSGCFSEKRYAWWDNHPVLIERAEVLCSEAGGVYKWGGDNDRGFVQCYDLSSYNTFTRQPSE